LNQHIKERIAHTSMIALYNKRIKEFRDNGTVDQLYEYMMKASPFLKDYDESKNKNDLFKYFVMVTEENLTMGCLDAPMVLQCDGCLSSNVIYDESSSDIICKDCGIARYDVGSEQSYKEKQDTEQNIQYSYKKENHFNEWLAQIQAREATTIPPEIFDSIRMEFQKNKTTKSQITQKRVRDTLKKIGLKKYYEHVTYITSHLNGIKPPNMPKELEAKLRQMFHMIQEPFHRNRPDDRKNFLSYSYILYKFCELLSEDSYLPCFPLLKSKEKLYKQDLIWKKICDELNWQYIATI